MKYSEVKEGQIFFIDGCYTYPKIKVGLGHRDIRDNVSNTHGNPDWEVEVLQDPALRTRLEEAEKVAEEMAIVSEQTWELFDPESYGVYRPSRDLIDKARDGFVKWHAYRLKYPALPHTEGEQKG